MSRGLDRDTVKQPQREAPPQEMNRAASPTRGRGRRSDRETPERQRAERPRHANLSVNEQALLYEIGRFRTVAVQDLVRHAPTWRFQAMRDLKRLVELGLASRRTALVKKSAGQLEVAVLTKAGKKMLEQAHANSDQAVYAGFVKRSEVAHDAAIYRMYQKEKGAIEKTGAKLRRVVLDYELKRLVYSPLAKVRGKVTPEEYAARQAEVAQSVHLKVVNGKIPLPDLRIEYETSIGEIARVDLELATDHYHGSHLQTKTEAGFKMYAADEGGRRTSIYEGREITADLLSL